MERRCRSRCIAAAQTSRAVSNSHTNGLNSLDIFEDLGEDFVGLLVRAASSQGPCSLGDCCAVSDSVGGRLSLLAPFEDATALLPAEGRDLKRR